MRLGPTPVYLLTMLQVKPKLLGTTNLRRLPKLRLEANPARPRNSLTTTISSDNHIKESGRSTAERVEIARSSVAEADVAVWT